MLVLTRKTNQSIMIGDEIEVSVLAVSRDKIRLGISAPRDVPVFRKEVYLSIQEEAGESDAEAVDGADAEAVDGADAEPVAATADGGPVATQTVQRALGELSAD
jgi:carbon storage regulator